MKDKRGNKKCCMSSSKDLENKSKKLCCCGGHSANDIKKNLNNHSTYIQYIYRVRKRFKNKLKEAAYTPYVGEYPTIWKSK